MGLLDWAAKAWSFIKPHAKSFIQWAAPKAIDWAGRKITDALANTASPFGSFVRNVGPTVAEWMGAKDFQNELAKFGTTVNNTAIGKLIRFPDGMDAGSALTEASNRMMNYLKTGGVAPTNNIKVDRMVAAGGVRPATDMNMAETDAGTRNGATLF